MPNCTVACVVLSCIDDVVALYTDYNDTAAFDIMIFGKMEKQLLSRHSMSKGNMLCLDNNCVDNVSYIFYTMETFSLYLKCCKSIEHLKCAYSKSRHTSVPSKVVVMSVAIEVY